MSEEKILVRVAVLCINSEGSPEFHTCAVEVTAEERKEGVHYDLAKENAIYNSFEEPMIAIDAGDPAAVQAHDLSWVTRGPENPDAPSNLMPQCYWVDALLKAAVAALPFLPKEPWESLNKVLAIFQNVSSVTTWSTEDVDGYGLSQAERREVIAAYLRDFEASDEDWSRLDRYARQIVASRPKTP